jgi:putative ABC transport system ATP-binding protein
MLSVDATAGRGVTGDASPRPALEVEGLVHRYEGREVLDLPRWQVGAGEAWLVLGPSGCGKSTLLHCAAGLLRAARGSIRVAGTELATIGAAERDRLRGRAVGLLPQRLHLIPALTVLDNLLVAQFAAGVPRDRARARSVLAALGLAGREADRPEQLSVGQQQRVALARAVINRPALLLADEPTSALDDANCASALDLLLSQAAECGAALVIATHDRRLIDRVPRVLTLPASRS